MGSKYALTSLVGSESVKWIIGFHCSENRHFVPRNLNETLDDNLADVWEIWFVSVCQRSGWPKYVILQVVYHFRLYLSEGAYRPFRFTVQR